MKPVRDGKCRNIQTFIGCLFTNVKEAKPFTSQASRYLKVLVSRFSSTDIQMGFLLLNVSVRFAPSFLFLNACLFPENCLQLSRLVMFQS